MAVRYPVVPNNITIHLGAPNEQAKDITIPFTEYIANVASSEIYPTWPENAIIANIYAIISFTLNRIYNEWYRSKGYNFDITSSPIYDQTYIENRSIYENIQNIVDEIFNNYVVKDNQIQPYFTKYCDGRKTTCDGLSQWGTVSLANAGKTPIEILRNYYGNDINIVYDAPVGGNTMGYPGYEIGTGSTGNPVLAIQRDLRRIKNNYPAIPEIKNRIGMYDKSTEDAVKKFQEIFGLPVTGIVNKATWYKIKYIYTSVKKLADLYSEGLTEDDVNFLYTELTDYGSTGIGVEYFHYYLSNIAFFDKDIPYLPLGSVYDDNTVTMLKAFQKKNNLPVTGILSEIDWQVLKNTYDKILKDIPTEFKDYSADLFPSYFLSKGMQGEDVLRLQRYLLEICKKTRSIPGVRVTGEFDELTERSIKKIQRDLGIEENGIVGPIVWDTIVNLSKEK